MSPSHCSRSCLTSWRDCASHTQRRCVMGSSSTSLHAARLPALELLLADHDSRCPLQAATGEHEHVSIHHRQINMAILEVHQLPGRREKNTFYFAKGISWQRVSRQVCTHKHRHTHTANLSCSSDAEPGLKLPRLPAESGFGWRSTPGAGVEDTARRHAIAYQV